MLNKIYIVSSDDVFARMLELDLCAEFRGAQSFVSVLNCGALLPESFDQPASDAASEDETPTRCSIVISDIALLTRRMRKANGLIALTGSGSRIPPYLPEQPDVVFTRPFLISELRKKIFSMLTVSALFPSLLTRDKMKEVEETYPFLSPKPAETEDSPAEDALIVDLLKKTAAYSGVSIPLTRREFELLAYLYTRRGFPVSREELIREVWRFNFTGDTNVVDVYIRYLREKLDERFGVKLILTVRGKGYMLK